MIIPKYGETSELVKKAQIALNKEGASPRLTEDGNFGPKTKTAFADFQKKNGLGGSGLPGTITMELLGFKDEPIVQSGNSAYDMANKYKGKKETDSAFQAEMNQYWGKAKLPNFKGLVGSARAWCALFLIAMLSKAGYDYTNATAAAISFDKVANAVNWRVDGIAKGDIVRINGSGNCKSSAGNHVTFSDGDCAAADLLKPGASFPGLGGNQGNMVKVSSYPVRNICAVRRPKELKVPIKILKSKNCLNAKADNESTR